LDIIPRKGDRIKVPGDIGTRTVEGVVFNLEEKTVQIDFQAEYDFETFVEI
jgi:hypothetical protein